MSDHIQLSRGDLTPRQTVRRSGGSRRTDIAGARTLEPVIQSALGIVRESAGMLYHIAGFGIALLSDAKNSHRKYSTRPARPIAAECANVIPFPSSKMSGHRPTFTQE
jgi:hypothetical protein